MHKRNLWSCPLFFSFGNFDLHIISLLICKCLWSSKKVAINFQFPHQSGERHVWRIDYRLDSCCTNCCICPSLLCKWVTILSQRFMTDITWSRSTDSLYSFLKLVKKSDLGKESIMNLNFFSRSWHVHFEIAITSWYPP